MPGTAMLILRENILERFVANLAWASEIDLATIWATGDGTRYEGNFVDGKRQAGEWRNGSFVK